MGVIADGPLLDCLRRAVTFGLFLVRLDVRQDPRATPALSEITDYLGLGRYAEWDEARAGFLLEELNNRRPLLPALSPTPTPPKCSPPAAKSPRRRAARWAPM
jgi:phosphoenolpyruvate carboxylase